jgi:uncharacterized membrane protein YphA (DoxX/SURF4 family)
MDGLTTAGRYIFAISMGAFGVQYLIYAHSAPDLINIPPYTVARPLSAYLVGICLVGVTLSVASGKKAVVSARLLGAGFFLVFLIFYLLKILAFLLQRSWGQALDTRGFETLATAATAFVLAAAFPAEGGDFLGRPFSVRTTAQAGRILFAISLATFGVMHVRYPRGVASLIPAWIPARVFLAYFTGAGFLAAALSIALGKVTRLAGSLLAAMFLIWVVVLHSPRVAHALHNGDEWSSLLFALCMGGAGFIFAGAFPKKD